MGAVGRFLTNAHLNGQCPLRTAFFLMLLGIDFRTRAVRIRNKSFSSPFHFISLTSPDQWLNVFDLCMKHVADGELRKQCQAAFLECETLPLQA